MNYASYSSINQNTFYMLFSKQIKLLTIYIKFHLKKILNLFIKNCIGSVRVILFYILKIIFKLRIITRFIPYQIKMTIRAKIILYPKLTLILKKINNWVNLGNVTNKSFFENYFLKNFFKRILIRFLYFFLNKELFRKIIIDKLKEDYNIVKNLHKKNDFSTTQTTNILDLSPEALEIYKNFQFRINNIYLDI